MKKWCCMKRHSMRRLMKRHSVKLLWPNGVWRNVWSLLGTRIASCFVPRKALFYKRLCSNVRKIRHCSLTCGPSGLQRKKMAAVWSEKCNPPMLLSNARRCSTPEGVRSQSVISFRAFFPLRVLVWTWMRSIFVCSSIAWPVSLLSGMLLAWAYRSNGGDRSSHNVTK